MRKTSKVLALMLIMMISVAVFFTSCGGPSNFEEFVKEDAELQEQIEGYETSDSNGAMTVDIKGNDIIYTYKYKQTLDDETIATVKELFEQQMDSQGSAFEMIAQKCEEESEIDGIKVKVIFLNGDDTEMYSGTFE